MSNLATSSLRRVGPEVRASAGTVRGSWDDGVAVFLGIPFAQPPVGTLRLAAPRRVPPWAGVRSATSYGPPPPQAAASGTDEAGRHASGNDWLTINVWTPDPGRDARLPVMVWIHGGAYTMGVSSLPEYDGARLARDGAVVVVTFNYRVGLEGFGLIAEAPANRGLLDQVAALHWVHENIATFGGDPDRITVFGQSAGGGSVAALLAMPVAAGLVRRAVVQSMPGTYFSPDLAAEMTAWCAASLGLRPTATDLGTVSPARLSAAGEALGTALTGATGRWGAAGYRSIPFAPVVDGDTLPTTPWRGVADGSARDVDLLVGHTRDEQRLLTLLEGRLGHVTEEHAETALTMLAPGEDGALRYREGYPAAGPAELYELVTSDWLFRMPCLHLAEAQVAAGGRAYLYELTWPAPGMDGELGACHGLDVPLVFGNLDRGLPAMLLGEGPNAEAEPLSARMRKAWTAFADTGDPGWPMYDPEHRLVQLFDNQPRVARYPEETSRLIWQDHDFAALRPLPGSPPEHL